MWQKYSNLLLLPFLVISLKKVVNVLMTLWLTMRANLLYVCMQHTFMHACIYWLSLSVSKDFHSIWIIAVADMFSPQCTSLCPSSSWPCRWDDRSVDTHRVKVKGVIFSLRLSDQLQALYMFPNVTVTQSPTIVVLNLFQQVSSDLIKKKL